MEQDINKIKSKIIYEDDHIVVINKPANLLTIQDGYTIDLPNLTRALKHIYTNIWVVHRLDKQTSGVNVFARNAAAHKSLSMQFQNREVKKEYHCIARGKADWDEKLVQAPLKVNGDRKHRTIPSQAQGKPAETYFKVINANGEFLLLKAFPRSGYRHQIRSHLKYLGLGIIRDDLYGKGMKQIAGEIPIQRLALHAFQIGFTHPVSNKPTTFQARYPDDFTNAILALKISA